jgi:hypothetical protein
MKLILYVLAGLLVWGSSDSWGIEAAGERREAIVLDIELGDEFGSRSFRIMTLDAEAAEITFAPVTDEKSANQSAGSLQVRPFLANQFIEVEFEWTPLQGRETAQFKMQVVEGEPSSIAAVGENGHVLEVGIIAERANPVERELLVSSQIIEGQLSRSTNCGYQYCAGSTWACCGVCPRCDVGCGWFGPICQEP